MRKAAFLGFILASLTLLAPLALAQTKAQREATDAFRTCREMEEYGDATPCWRRWLEKHKDSGNEAEVMVAEERVNKAKPPPKEEPKEEPKEKTEDEKSEEPVEEDATEAAPVDEPETEVAVVPMELRSSGDDLCANAPDPKAGRSTKQRVVVFGIAGSEALNQDTQLEKAGATRHLNEVFLSRFPSARFFNVTTTLPGDNAWTTAKTLSLGDVKTHVQKKGGNSGAAQHLERSVGCAEYLVFTTLENFSAKPGDTPAGVDIEMTAEMGIFRVSGTEAKLLDSFDATVPSLFDKAEDAAAQTAASGMEGATSSTDSANQLANQGDQLADTAGDAAKGVGDTASSIASGEVPEGAAAGASSECAEGEECPAEASSPLIDQPSSDAHERLGSVCMNAKKQSNPDAVKSQLLACEIRVRAYMLAKNFREASLSVPGWQLSAPLMKIEDRYGIALGEAEDLSVGDGFVVLDEDGSRLAYFKVIDVGPGGTEGETLPSEVALRTGTPSDGAVLSEHRMLGLGLQLHGAVLFTVGAQEHFSPFVVDIDGEEPFEALRFKIPSLMFGGGGALSYDLSSLLSWPESSIRAGADYLAGSGASTQATMIATELVFEKGFYLGKALEFYMGLGGAFSLIQLKSIPEYNPVPVVREEPDRVEDIFGQIVEMSGTRIGGTALAGLEWLLTPNVGLRLEGTFRLNVAKASYDSPNPAVSQCPEDPLDPSSPIAADIASFPDSRACWGFDQRKDSWNSAAARLGAIVMF